MEITTSTSHLFDVQADWLIAGVWEDGGFDPILQNLDDKLKRALSLLREKGDLTGKALELVPLWNLAGIKADRLLLVGLGKRKDWERAALVSAASAAAKFITEKAYTRLAMALPENISGLDGQTLAYLCGLGLQQGCEGPGIRKTNRERFPPGELILVAPPALQEQVQAGARKAEVVGRGVSLARELVNTPPCDLYPETFAARAQQAAQSAGLECTIFDENQLEKERMGSLLAVARGSDRPPRMVILRHRGGKEGEGKTLGLIGKGVTFDSGGLSLKTNEQMVDMKCDMAGAAAVLGAMTAIGELNLPVNVLGILALVENLPSGKAMKLGDVLKARNGKTIEVLNTDAEGRLILADALSYAVDAKVDRLVDLATLTGACMVALGSEVAGLMSNDESWSNQVLAAAREAGERAWPLPMFPLYKEMIRSEVADIRNTGGTRYAGAISAAKFLEEFVGETPWAHLDIAGPAWAEKENASRDAGGTGCFVRTLVDLARAFPTAM